MLCGASGLRSGGEGSEDVELKEGRSGELLFDDVAGEIEVDASPRRKRFRKAVLFEGTWVALIWEKVADAAAVAAVRSRSVGSG